MATSPPSLLCVSFSVSYQDLSLDLGITRVVQDDLTPDPLLTTPAKAPFPNRSPCEVPGRHEFWGTTFDPLPVLGVSPASGSSELGVSLASSR